MRTLKKALSLVLILAMVLSLGVSAFAVDAKEFGDYDKVENKTAVTVLTGLEVISGRDNNTYDPTATFNRAEAATIIARMSLGPKVAAALPSNTATQFNDVPATHWAAKYIQYCANEGIITGYGDGNFGPNDTLTATQWALMLLKAAKIEGVDEIGGTGWEISTTRLAVTAEIATADDLSSTFNRDVAAKLALNGLLATKDGGSEYVVYASEDENANVLYRGTDAITAMLMKSANENSVLKLEKNTTGSLADTVFKMKVVSTVDDFNRKTTEYNNGKAGKDKAVYATAMPEIALSYTAGTTLGKIVSDLGYTKAADKVTLNVSTNGATAEKKENVDRTMTADANKIGGNGTLIEVYKTDTSDVYDVVVVETNAYQLKTADIHKAKKATSTSDAVAAYITIDGKNFETDAFKSGDVVLYTATASKLVNVVAADYVVASVTASASGYVRLDGEQTYLSANTDLVAGSGLLAPSTDKNTFYFDSYGNIIFAVAGETSAPDTKYVYVIAAASKEADQGGDNLFDQSNGTAAQAQLKVVDLTTGEVKVVNEGVVLGTDNKYYYATKTGAASKTEVTNTHAAVNEGVYAYVELENGSYVLDGEVITEEAVTIKKNVAEVSDGKFANKDTVLTTVAITKDSKDNVTSGAVTTVTGIANFPETAVTSAILVADNNNTVTRLIVVKDAAGASLPYAVYNGLGETNTDGETAYNFYASGEQVSYYAGENVIVGDLNKGDVVTLNISGNKLTKDPAKQTAKASGAITRADDSYIVINGDAYNFAAEYEVVNAGDEYSVVTDTLAVDDNVDVYTNADNQIVFVVVKAD